MNIVITMAGLGSRFRKAGYNVPKYMIEVRGRSLFEWSMMSLQNFVAQTKRIFFIVRKEDAAYDFILEKASLMNFQGIEIIEIDYLTEGQAATAMLAASHWDKSDALLVYNIDTYVESDAMVPAQFHGDGFIPCFVADGDHWSFVRLDPSGKAVEVREKKRISDYCTIGAYYFRTGQLYEQLYDICYRKNNYTEAKEQYIAPMYNELIKMGREVYICNIQADKVHVLGTPEELELFKL